MSSFIPLNLIEDASVSRKEKEAEHTRELQIEEAFKIFDRALSLQKDHQYAQCYKEYEALMKLEVISNHYDEELMFIKGLQSAGASTVTDELNFLPPNVKSLRYLVFRNRAFLYLGILQSKTPVSELLAASNVESNGSTNELETNKQLFYTMMDDLVICLIYQEADEELIHILYEITVYIDCLKMARYLLEYILNSKQESDDILGLLPIDQETEKLYRSLKSRLEFNNDNDTVFQQDYDRIQRKYGFLEPFKLDIKKQIENTRLLKAVSIEARLQAGSPTWTSVVSAINDKIKAEEDKFKTQNLVRAKIKDIDPYGLATSVMSKVQIIIPEQTDIANDPNSENDEPIIETEDIQNSEQSTNPLAGGIAATDQNKEEEDGDIIVAKHESKSASHGDQEIANDTKKEETKENGETDSRNATPAGEEKTSQTKNMHRSSKRLQKQDLEPVSYLPDLQVTHEMFIETTNFVKELNSFLHTDGNFKTKFKINDIVDMFVSDKVPYLYVDDFKALLNDYSPKDYSSSLFLMDEIKPQKGPETGKNDNERLKLLEVLRLFGSRQNGGEHEKTELIDKLDKRQCAEVVQAFVENLNQHNFHVNDTKFAILEHLLCYQAGTDCLIIDALWPTRFYNDIRTWIMQLNQQLLSRSRYQLVDQQESTIVKQASLAMSVFEILTDYYISLKTKIDSIISQNVSRGITKSLKANLNVQTSEVIKLKDIIEKWKIHLECLLGKLDAYSVNKSLVLHIGLRFEWTLVHKEKIENANFQNSQFIYNELSDLTTLLRTSGVPAFRILTPNYVNIAEISEENVATLSSTVSVLTMFARILFAKEDENNSEAIELLEQTLIDDKSTSIHEEPTDPSQKPIVAIRRFLANSSIDIRLSLWNILFAYYDKTDNFSRFQYGFERNAETLLNYLKSSQYSTLDYKTRASNFLKVVAFFDEYVVMYFDHLAQNKWILLETEVKNKASISATFGYLVELFEVLYLFSLHEEAALISSQKNSLYNVSLKVYNKFKSMLIRITSIMVVYYGGLLRVCSGNIDAASKQTIHFMSLIHSQYGFRGLCDSGEGIFLRIFQESLFDSDWKNSESDLVQLIRCRYHCIINVKGITSYNHQTSIAEELDEESTLKLARFILPLCMSKDPLFNPPKGDLKLLVDQLYNVIGDPDYDSNCSLAKNQASLTDFLDRSTISASFVRDAFYGLHENNQETVVDKRSDVVRDGLYLLQALLLFSSYKVRKKSMQGRSVELETVISLIHHDLIYCPDRVESWFSLGLAYGFLVEDDLIWTSDKLTILDRKIATANIQRKSLVCYLMAINFMGSIKDTWVHSKQLVSALTSSFANEMYAACTIPMDMLAFKAKESPKFIRKDSGASFVPVAPQAAINKDLCLKIIQQSLHLAIKADPSEWSNYYLLSKVQGKLKKEPADVIETLLEAGVYASEQSVPTDTIIEPHYRLCSSLYKYVKHGKIDVSAAFCYLEKDPLLKEYVKLPNDTKNQQSFFELLVECLKKFAALDKKKWHHKYRYRLSKILLDEFNSTSQAREEMSFMISLKPTSKTLVAIWKPENERPGKHFYYTFQYTIFFIEILCKEYNLVGLLQMLPRLRRSNSIMISLSIAWETLCSAVCRILRDLFQVTESFTDSFLVTPYILFMEHSRNLVATFKGEAIPEGLKPHVCLLASLNEMKKLNNGFGPTSLIDDTIVAIFIKIYYSLPSGASQGQSIHDSPTAKPKRLAKRDIFPVVNDILAAAKRNIDAVIKETPDFLNKFAASIREQRERPLEVFETVDTDARENRVSTTPLPLLNEDTQIMQQRENTNSVETAGQHPDSNSISSTIVATETHESQKSSNNDINGTEVGTENDHPSQVTPSEAQSVKVAEPTRKRPSRNSADSESKKAKVD